MTNTRPHVCASLQIGAVVLCGGHSRRMGEPKAWLHFRNERLLQRVVRQLSIVAHRIVVVRAPGQTLPELPHNVLITEDARQDRGPLQGIASGLAALQGTVDNAFVSSTDAPFFDPNLVTHLSELRGTSYDLVVPQALGRRHPLAAIYALDILPEIERMLAEHQLRLMDLLDRVRTLVVDEDELRKIDPRLRFLTNMNTKAEYEAALAQDDDA